MDEKFVITVAGKSAIGASAFLASLHRVLEKEGFEKVDANLPHLTEDEFNFMSSVKLKSFKNYHVVLEVYQLPLGENCS